MLYAMTSVMDTMTLLLKKKRHELFCSNSAVSMRLCFKRHFCFKSRNIFWNLLLYLFPLLILK